MKATRLRLTAFATLLVFCGCKPEADSPSSDATAGGSSDAGGSTPAEAGQGGDATTKASGGAGGTAGEGGEVGETGGVGAAPDDADAGGIGGSAGGAGDSGQLADLLGPTTNDPEISVLTSDKIVLQNATAIGAAMDPDGDLVIAGRYRGSYALSKLDDSLSQVWLQQPLADGADQFTVNAIDVSNNGDIYIGGQVKSVLPGETHVGTIAGDAVVGKFDADGQQVWMHQWGSDQGAWTGTVRAMPDGSVVAGALCSGQAPGNPPTNQNGPVVAKYSASGDRSWLVQFQGSSPNPEQPRSLLVDASGRIYAFGGQGLRKIGPNGAELSNESPLPSKTPDFVPILGIFGAVVFHPGNDTFFDSSYVNGNLGGPIVLAELDLDGSPRWYRKGGTQSAVIDAVEGELWTGSFPTNVDTSPLTATSNAVYLTGSYVNSYQNGSSPKPQTTTGFIGRYDLRGNRVWFRELKVDVTDIPGATEDMDSRPTFAAITVDKDGDLVVVANAQGPVIGTGTGHLQFGDAVYAFRLHASDGSLF